jgi:hypothetical protein
MGKRAGKVQAPMDSERLLRSNYYSDDDLEAIVQTLEPKPDFDRERFVKRLNLAALELLEYMRDEDTKPPSTRARFSRGFRTRILENPKLQLTELSAYQLTELQNAAVQLAEEGDEPPGCELERVEYHGRDGSVRAELEWSVDEIVEPDHQGLALRLWLPRCIERAAENARKEKDAKGGNRPNTPEQQFVCTAITMFAQSSQDRPTLYKHRKVRKGAGTVVRGNLMPYLHACLRPLGYKGGDVQVYRLCERIKWKELIKNC